MQINDVKRFVSPHTGFSLRAGRRPNQPFEIRFWPVKICADLENRQLNLRVFSVIWSLFPIKQRRRFIISLNALQQQQ